MAFIEPMHGNKPNIVLTTPSVVTRQESSTSGIDTETLSKSAAGEYFPLPHRQELAEALDFSSLPATRPGEFKFHRINFTKNTKVGTVRVHIFKSYSKQEFAGWGLSKA